MWPIFGLAPTIPTLLMTLTCVVELWGAWGKMGNLEAIGKSKVCHPSEDAMK